MSGPYPNMTSDEFLGRLDSIDCPMTRDLVERLMHKIEEFRAMARSCCRRKDHKGGMAFDDMSDELVLMLEGFLREVTGPADEPKNPAHN